MLEHIQRSSKDDLGFLIVTYAVVTVLFAAVLYPIVYVVSSSFSSPSALAKGDVWLLPVKFTLEGYRRCFQYKDVWLGYSNSVFYTITGTSVNVLLTIITAYPLSRKDFIFRNGLMFLFAFTMWFSGGLIPSFLLIKSLGLYNSRLALIIPGALSVYNMIITRTFFQSNIPDELLESAKLDGCSDFRFVVSIAAPLSKAIIAVIGLFYAVGHWNSYFSAFIYLNERNKFPLQIFLREILIMSQMTGFAVDGSSVADMATMSSEAVNEMSQMAELLKYSLIIVASLPLIIVYPFIQKNFTKGVMIGALKG